MTEQLDKKCHYEWSSGEKFGWFAWDPKFKHHYHQYTKKKNKTKQKSIMMECLQL